MAFRYTKYKPSIVFQTGTLEMNLDLALNVFSIENENLQKANLLFLEIVMKNCYDVPESNEEQVNQVLFLIN